MESRCSRLVSLYYPSFDGLRGIAILSVLVFHLGIPDWTYPPVWWGWVGVDLFFVLFGFLITGILLDTIHRPDYFRNFYIRRALRIFPLYYLMLFAIALFTLLPKIHADWNWYFLTWPSYLGNLFIPGGRSGLHHDIEAVFFHVGSGPQHKIVFMHLWSLCVEEQFYLVWPALVWFLRKRSTLLWICAAVIVIEPIARIGYLHFHPDALGHTDATYILTPLRADALMMGAAVALWLRGADPSPVHYRRIAAVTIVVPLLLLVLVNWFWPGRHPASPIARYPIVTIGLSFVGLVSTGLLLLSLDSTNLVAGWLRITTLVWIGRMSYGIYVLHMFTLDVVPRLAKRALTPLHLASISPVLSIAVSILLGWLSFRFFESRFLALKPRLAPRQGAADDPPPFLKPLLVEG